ncbi:DUF4943 family protein [Niabella yanshanensis]|uniref:DUF4943 family protein n=1 Tax=Niabella yanshanensis TaxID=577386 RepID=A0ABZ0WBA3_9BACT|nr:DUF4943 family protein [Niabella yanshanensis]WQD39904.1 DUF4943 family protein [Niabella yanshanensis]
MNKLLLFSMSFFFLLGCKKNGFDVNNPDVDLFVSQLKSGSYNEREVGDDGKPLWLKMPRFGHKHVARLIELSKDTARIEKFPTNPISSRRPHPEGRDYFILGECLLAVVEIIREKGWLDPYLIDTSKDIPERFKGVTGVEILMISDQYRQWWSNYKDGDWKGNNPLANTPYKWM